MYADAPTNNLERFPKQTNKKSTNLTDLTLNSVPTVTLSSLLPAWHVQPHARARLRVAVLTKEEAARALTHAVDDVGRVIIIDRMSLS